MAIIRTKGTKLQQQISTVFTDRAQVISMELPEQESETFEADTLDNSSAGIPYEGTGRSEGGSLSGELFLDPTLTSHTDMLDLIENPPAIGSNESWKVVFADSGSTEWPFDGAGFSMGGTVALNDGLKGSFSIKLDGVVTFP